MKKFYAIALVLVLTVCLFAGCRSRQNDTNGNTDMPTNTTESNMLPDSADTIDPTNGANQEPESSETTEVTEATELIPDDDGRSRGRIFPSH